MRGLRNRWLFLEVLEARKSRIRAASQAAGEDSLALASAAPPCAPPGSRGKSSGGSSSFCGWREGLPLLQESDPGHLRRLQTASQCGYGPARILTDSTFSPQEGLQIPGPSRPNTCALPRGHSDRAPASLKESGKDVCVKTLSGCFKIPELILILRCSCFDPSGKSLFHPLLGCVL